MTTASSPKKLARAEAMRRASVMGRRFLTDHPQGAAETLTLDMAQAAERAAITIPNWWTAYAVSAGFHHSILKSTTDERWAFCDWLEKQGTRLPNRFIPVAKPKRRRVPRQPPAKLVRMLDALVMQHGRDPVVAWLEDWMNLTETPD